MGIERIKRHIHKKHRDSHDDERRNNASATMKKSPYDYHYIYTYENKKKNSGNIPATESLS